ncbi:MAG: glycine cleavage T C-terminal barrel domain-containing protein [Bryobacteraceae bacterium]|jgi:aminomethyltransferase
MNQGYEALRRGAAWMDLSVRGRIAVRGRDRARLLHNLTSNEVKKLAAGSGCYAFLLSPQGRIQADLTLLAFDDRILLDTEPELREKIAQHIRRYIVADQVELEDVTAATCAIALEGPESALVLEKAGGAAPSDDYRHLRWRDAGDITIARISLTGQPGFRVYAAAGAADEIIHRFVAAGAQPATGEDARLVRLENGRPRYGEDIRDTSLPQETGQMHAVSFSKGCYIGQEIVERIRAQGHVNRKLVQLRLDSAAPAAAGARLTADGAEAGEITSSVYSPAQGCAIALAYVRSLYAAPGQALAAGDMAAVVTG